MEQKQNKKEREEQHMVWHAFASFCITPKMQEAVLAYFGSPKNALLAGENDWNIFFHAAERFGFTEAQKARIREVRRKDFVREYENLKKSGIGLLIQEEELYPERLRRVFSAPRYLYYKGSAPVHEPMIAVIGARNCSNYGSGTAWRIARELAEQGVGVVSGLAYGVDKAAHEGAFAGGGPTFAVLGCGVDICYPRSHADTYERILSADGGIVSEYPPGTQPLSCFFPQRNRIIAGLSDGILVTEARKKSGTLITVSFGLEYGKNIYAIPGRTDDALSEGCNYLIREGAKLTLAASDILEDITGGRFGERVKKNAIKCRNYDFLQKVLATNEKMVYASLRLKPKHIDEIREETKLSPEALSEALQILSSYHCIKRYGQAYYALSDEMN